MTDLSMSPVPTSSCDLSSDPDVPIEAAPLTVPGLRAASLDFRLATMDDRPDLQRIEYSSRARYHSLAHMTRVSDRDPYPLERFDPYIEGGAIYVATTRLDPDPNAPDTILGYIEAMPPDDIHSEFRRLFICSVHVPILYERQGVGRRLVQFIEQLGRSRGVLALDAIVLADVPWCRGFCEAAGFSLRHWKELENNSYAVYLLRVWKELVEDLKSDFEWVAMRRLL